MHTIETDEIASLGLYDAQTQLGQALRRYMSSLESAR